MRKEYSRTLELSFEDIQKLEYAQDDIYDFINGVINEKTLEKKLEPISSLVGLAFIKSTVVGLVLGIVGLVLGMIPDEKEDLNRLIFNGSRGLRDVKRTMGEAELVRVKLPFVEFVNEGFRMIQGKGAIEGYYKDGQWIL